MAEEIRETVEEIGDAVARKAQEVRDNVTQEARDKVEGIRSRPKVLYVLGGLAVVALILFVASLTVGP